VQDLVARLYGLSGHLSPLTSERDQNLLLRQTGGNADGQGFVVKISNASEPPALTDFQVQALRYLERRSPGPGLPRMVAGKGGEFVFALPGGSSLRVLTYLEGIPLHKVRRSPAQGADLLQWDIKQAHRLPPLLPAIADPDLRALASQVVAAFTDQITPVLGQLPVQVVHADLNPHNVLVAPDNPDRIAGILDFGDMVKTPRICDVAVAASYLVDPSDPLAGLSPFLAGYGAVIDLLPEETDCLHLMIMARMVTTLAITSRRAASQPQNAAYILRNFASAETGLRALAQVNPGAARAHFRSLMQGNR
jgi:Ser/Thr protein kinase RdoA (MazF antagonist)